MTSATLTFDAAKAYLAPVTAPRRSRLKLPSLGLTATETKLFHAWRP